MSRDVEMAQSRRPARPEDIDRPSVGPKTDVRGPPRSMCASARKVNGPRRTSRTAWAEVREHRVCGSDPRRSGTGVGASGGGASTGTPAPRRPLLCLAEACRAHGARSRGRWSRRARVRAAGCCRRRSLSLRQRACGQSSEMIFGPILPVGGSSEILKFATAAPSLSRARTSVRAPVGM